MTVMELRLILSKLPPECQQWPVVIDIEADERPAAGIILAPPGYADYRYPDGSISIAAFVGNPPKGSDIRVYRPEANAPGR